MRKVWIALCLLAVVICGVFFFKTRRELQSTQEASLQLQAELDGAKAKLTDSEKNIFINEKALEMFEKNQEDVEESQDLALFISPEDIRFRSRSSAWNEDKLEALYQELLLNKHGEELNSLSDVIVYGEPDDYAAASHQTATYGYTLELCFPSFPLQDLFSFYREGGIINLYNGNENTTPESMASSLSHEYGHHYTFHYMLHSETAERVYLGTEYERLRQIDPDRVRAAYLYANDYRENHHWYYYEVAAEDYVVLMGSPNSRSVHDYYDIKEALNGRDDAMGYGKNMDVQENLMIPMASQVPGLAEYFYSFIDEPVPIFDPKELMLNVKKRSASYNLSIGYKTYTYYEFTWDKVYGEDAVYTLVCFDEDDYADSLYPIKTVTVGEEASAVVGSVTKRSGSMVHIMEDNLTEGTKTFIVTVILPDGTMYCSEPLEYTF